MENYDVDVDSFESLSIETRMAYINHAHLLWERNYVLSEFSVVDHIDHPYDLAIHIWKRDRSKIIVERALQEEKRKIEENALHGY